MTNQLSALHDRLMERLPKLEKVRVYENSLEDFDRRHLVPNVVRLRIALEQSKLRLGISGLIGAVHPDLLQPDDEPEEVRMERIFSPCLVMPPIFPRKKEECTSASLVTRGHGTVLAISADDGGLGTITIDEDFSTTHGITHTMVPGLEWQKQIQKICWAIVEEIEQLQKK